jgi:hypothetical protein
MMVADSILAELRVANCAVAVIDFMFARARFLHYPNLASNSEFRRLGRPERAGEEGAVSGAGIGSEKGSNCEQKSRKNVEDFDVF